MSRVYLSSPRALYTEKTLRKQACLPKLPLPVKQHLRSHPLRHTLHSKGLFVRAETTGRVQPGGVKGCNRMEGTTSGQPSGEQSILPSQVMDEYPNSPMAERAPRNLIVQRTSPLGPLAEAAPPTQLAEEHCQVKDG